MRVSIEIRFRDKLASTGTTSERSLHPIRDFVDKYREKSGTSARPDPDLTEATFDAPQSTRAISWPKARAPSQQSGRLRVTDTARLSLTFPGRSWESSAASVPESRPRRISLARG